MAREVGSLIHDVATDTWSAHCARCPFRGTFQHPKRQPAEDELLAHAANCRPAS